MVVTIATSVGTSDGFEPWVLIVAPPIVCALVGLLVSMCLHGADLIMRLVGRSGIEAISRLMGFLLVVMGVQFVINGVPEIVATLGHS
jgi:multiple antibiotic resistance protein